MKFLLSILVIIGNLKVLLANNDNCRENDLNALMVRLRVLRTDFDKQKKVLEDQKAETEDLRQNTSSEIAEIKESMKNMTEVVGNIIKDLEESTSGLDNLKVVTDEINKKCEDGLSDLNKKLERQADDLRSSSTELSKRLAALEKQMKELDQTTEKKTQTVAFNVADAVSYTGSDAIKFSYIILNEGNAYNKDTGIFTAPIDGIYQFNAHICGNKSKDEIDYNIKVNSQWIVSGEFTIPARATDAKCTSFSAVALVKKGENVRVGGMSFPHLDDYHDDYCSFSGVLIQNI